MAGDKGLGFLPGLLIGGLLGVAATIAIVPELDEETRRKIAQEGMRLRERAAQLATSLRAEADVLLDQGRATLADQKARLEEAISEGKEAAAEKQRELRAKFDQAQDEGEAHL